MDKSKNLTKGIMYIVISAFFFALMNVFVKSAGDIPSLQKAFFRNLVSFLVALVWVKKDGIHFSGKKENIKYLLLRASAGSVGIFCNFYAIDRLVISDASMLNKMSPFFAVVFSFFILKEKIRLPQIAMIFGAFLGSLLILKPEGSSLISVPALVGFAGGMAAGLAYTFLRKLGECGEKGPFVVMFFSAFSCILTLPYMIVKGEPITGFQLLMLLFAGVSAAMGQFGITAAYFHAPAREISVYDYSQIIFAAILGFLIFGQMPDVYSWIGYLVICTMAVLMYMYNNKKFIFHEIKE